MDGKIHEGKNSVVGSFCGFVQWPLKCYPNGLDSYGSVGREST